MAKEMMKEAANSVSKEVSGMKAKADVSAIQNDLETLKEDAKVLRDDALVLGKDLKEEGRKRLSAAELRAQEAMEEAREKGREQLAYIANFVQNNPAQSLAIAFVGGVIANMLLGRRR